MLLTHQQALLLAAKSIMHQSFETPAPPHLSLSRGLWGLSPHIQFILVPRQAGNSLDVMVFASPTGLFAGHSKMICFFRGSQLCFLTSVLRLSIISYFAKGVPCVEKQGLVHNNFQTKNKVSRSNNLIKLFFFLWGWVN